MAIYDELEQLKARLVTLVVLYPDFGVRVDESVSLYDHALVTPGPNVNLLVYIGTDMVSLLQYFREIYQEVEETRIQLKPIMALLEGLTEPV